MCICPSKFVLIQLPIEYNIVQNKYSIAIFLVTSPIVIIVPTRKLLAVETKSSF